MFKKIQQKATPIWDVGSEPKGQYKLHRGKTSSITALRMRHWEMLDFEWDCLSAAWEGHFEGTCRVSAKFTLVFLNATAKHSVELGPEPRSTFRLYKEGRNRHDFTQDLELFSELLVGQYVPAMRPELQTTTRSSYYLKPAQNGIDDESLAMTKECGAQILATIRAS
jgi:hypothetical protein